MARCDRLDGAGGRSQGATSQPAIVLHSTRELKESKSPAPAELPPFEIEPHARAAERADAKDTVNARRVSGGRCIEDESGQAVPVFSAERHIIDAVSQQVSRTGCVLNHLFSFPADREH